ncbi:MAG: MFS transporter [Planctomycetaceae bacterium]|nr:MFS transporter [Planctomycetaceae bacterium]
MSDDSTGQRPSRAKYTVILFAISLAIVTYIHRVCISQAAPEIQSDLGLTKEQMSLVFSAFILAYGLFEVPGGWLSDQLGPRRVLAGAVLMWSFFTMATGWAWGLASLVVFRFLFGVGQATCFPNLTKIFTIWVPAKERVLAQGIMWLSARWGGAFTPLLVVGVMSQVSWQMAFVLFGALGILWTAVFWMWFRDNPADHSSVNEAELARLEGAEHNSSGHGDVPWGKLVTNPSVLLLWLQYFCMSYGWYFYVTWLPTYLQEERHLSIENSALLAGVPLFFGGISCFVASLFLGMLEQRIGVTRAARRIVGFVGMAGASVMLVISPEIQSPTLAMVALGLASFSNDLAMPGAWGACMDVGGRYAGSLAGSMNMMGNLGGAFGPIFVAQILARSGENWTLTFWVSAALYALGAFCWLLIDPVTPLEGDSTSHSD